MTCRSVLWSIGPSVQGTSAQALERIVGYSRPDTPGHKPVSNGLNRNSSRCLYVVFACVWAARDKKGDNNARMGTGAGESGVDKAFSSSSRYISARWWVRPVGTRTSARLGRRINGLGEEARERRFTRVDRPYLSVQRYTLEERRGPI